MVPYLFISTGLFIKQLTQPSEVVEPHYIVSRIAEADDKFTTMLTVHFWSYKPPAAPGEE